jgi:hypothetical protein
MKKIYFLISLIIVLLIATVSADNVTIVTPYQTTPAPSTTGYIPTPSPISSPTPTPTISTTHYITQGETIYVNDTIDISGVVPPYQYLAYWNGYDMYESNASYTIEMSQYKSSYYHYYIDPTIFSTRIGKWYKYDGVFEKNSNSLAFVVYPQSFKNTTLRYQNGTIVNISKSIVDNYIDIEIPIQPPVEIKHISDYLIARGDSLKVKTNVTTNIWLFGRVDKLLDFRSSNSTSVDLSNDILSGFETGSYTIETQTIGTGSNNFTVKYDQTTKEIKWFDSLSFTIKMIDTKGLSPRVLEEKFNEITSKTLDVFKTYKLELQDPYIEIQSIRETYTPNYTINQAGDTEYNTNISYIEIKGYTNVAIGDTLKFIVDEKQQTPKTIKYYTTSAVAGGTSNPGDMRWFDVLISLDKYDLALGEHTITAYTNLSNVGTPYIFTLYSATPSSYIPEKTIRYISGRYGPEEFVPTPTPVVETVTVPVPGPTQIIRVEVTPSDEQVKAQQKIIADENIKTWAIRIIIIVGIIVVIWYLISLYLRRRHME